MALFDNTIEKDCMEWDGKIYKSIGYTIQASDTEEIIEEAFDYIAKARFLFTSAGLQTVAYCMLQTVMLVTHLKSVTNISKLSPTPT